MMSMGRDYKEITKELQYHKCKVYMKNVRLVIVMGYCQNIC